ncbi:MAG: ABC transporter ATP-binding protein [Candidatus Kerfeldbacteria bacterium]|nr:ABC transporter ATP-binding protein [Candidatus Kerfeldbacteria bacterium]
MIKVENLKKVFRSGSTEVRAVDGVNFEVATGQLVAIIGKSGSGKSTLLALLGALDMPTEGTIEIDGKNVTDLRGKNLLTYRRTSVGFVFQNYNLVPNLSALDNVMLPMEFAGRSAAERRSRAEHLLQSVGISGDILKRRPGKLSGGEQQRVAIARALSNKPKLVLADEPTGNLDTQTGQKIVELLRSLSRSEKTTIITVTHDQAIASLADKVYRLHDGKLTGS